MPLSYAAIFQRIERESYDLFKGITIQSHKACVDTVFEILNSSCSILDGLFKLLVFIPKNETNIKHKI